MILTKINNDNKSYNWIIYYVILGIIQALWTNPSAFPPTILRLGMMIAVFAPILFHAELILFVIPFFMILRGNLSTDYQYMPDIGSVQFYILIEILALIIYYKKLDFKNIKYTYPLILLMIYMGLVDILFNGELGKYATNIFIASLLIPFIRTKLDFHIFSASLISVCVLLSIYYIIMFDKFVVTFNVTEELERSGWKDPNYYSTLLNYGFLVASLYIVNYLNSEFIIFNKKLLIITAITIFAAVVMCASRGGFICYGALLLIILATSKIKWYWYICAILIISATIFILYNNGIFDVLLYRLFEEESISTGTGRIGIWQKAINNFDIQPVYNIILGGGNFHRLTLTNGRDPHNEFVSILTDYGVIGFCLFIFMIIKLLQFKKKSIIIRNSPVLFLILSIISLSPFMYVYVCFLVLWISSLKIYTYKYYS